MGLRQLYADLAKIVKNFVDDEAVKNLRRDEMDGQISFDYHHDTLSQPLGLSLLLLGS